jgi:hypothetical protein
MMEVQQTARNPNRWGLITEKIKERRGISDTIYLKKVFANSFPSI